MQQFKQVPGFPDYYVSATGDIVSCRRFSKWKVLKLGVGTTGYYTVNLYDPAGVPHVKKVHQLVMLAWVGPKPPGHCVNHKDGNKLNNSVSNLEYATFRENLAHAFNTGLRVMRRGVEHRSCKLTEAQVLRIRHVCKQGVSQTQLAQALGVNSSAISDVVNRKTWRHI